MRSQQPPTLRPEDPTAESRLSALADVAGDSALTNDEHTAVAASRLRAMQEGRYAVADPRAEGFLEHLLEHLLRSAGKGQGE